MLNRIKEIFLPKQIESKTKTETYFDIKIYQDDGTIFIEEKEVNVVHWDKRIYIFYDNLGNFLKKIHLSNHMTIVFENEIIR